MDSKEIEDFVGGMVFDDKGAREWAVVDKVTKTVTKFFPVAPLSEHLKEKR